MLLCYLLAFFPFIYLVFYLYLLQITSCLLFTINLSVCHSCVLRAFTESSNNVCVGTITYMSHPHLVYRQCVCSYYVSQCACVVSPRTALSRALLEHARKTYIYDQVFSPNYIGSNSGKSDTFIVTKTQISRERLDRFQKFFRIFLDRTLRYVYLNFGAIW